MHIPWKQATSDSTRREPEKMNDRRKWNQQDGAATEGKTKKVNDRIPPEKTEGKLDGEDERPDQSVPKICSAFLT